MNSVYRQILLRITADNLSVYNFVNADSSIRIIGVCGEIVRFEFYDLRTILHTSSSRDNPRKLYYMVLVFS